jgi:hypothetical protein
MTTRNEERLLGIWRGQLTASFELTPDQLRERARKFESQIRRRNVRDYLCFGLVAIGFVATAIDAHGALTRLGSVLMLLWALFSMYGLRRFGSTLPTLPESTAQACAAYHQRNLERQRDIALSWPWGVGLAFPGITLFVVGVPLSSNHPNWTFSIAVIGIFLFMYVGIVIHGKILAGQWQREIDALQALK